MDISLGRRRQTGSSSSKSYTDPPPLPHTHTYSLSYDIITYILGPIHDKVRNIQPIRKLSIWRAVLKRRYSRTPVNRIRCIWCDRNKGNQTPSLIRLMVSVDPKHHVYLLTRQPNSTNVSDTLDYSYNDASQDVRLPVIQIYRVKTKHLIITLYYTKDSIMLQGRAFCGWVDHELECHQFSVNAIDKLRPFSSTTTDDSDNTASVGNDSATATAATTAVGGVPTTSDNNNSIASVGCHDTTAAAAVIAVSDNSDNVV